MDLQKSYKNYDGSTDVRKFVTKSELEASLKNHDGEKKAQYIASKLVGPAMDVYLRLSDDDKKDPEKLKAELLKEFERGQLNREEAISELDSRKRLADETAETFVFKVNWSNLWIPPLLMRTKIHWQRIIFLGGS